MGKNTYPIVEGQYLRDILDQPRAMAATLGQLVAPKELGVLARRLRDGDIKRIVLTGMGASFHAFQPLFLRLNQHRFTALSIETSELVHYLERWLEPATLIIAASQSGESAEIVRLLEENTSRGNEGAAGRAAIVGVTNAADSALASEADATMLTMAGAESSVSCKTYVTSLMALHLLGGFLCGCDDSQTRDELAQAMAGAAAYLRGWEDHVVEMRPELEGVRDLFLLGRGWSLAACGAGALIVKESVRCHAEGMSGAAFRHGPLEMVNEQTFAAVFAGPETTRDLQARLLADIREAGGKTAWVGENGGSGTWNLPKTPAWVRPMVEILPVQMMTQALAAEAGIEAGRFARISKVTTTE